MIPDFKTYINESVWSDIHKRSNGQKERKEDDVNLLDRDGFVTYLNNRYVTVYPFPSFYHFVIDFTESYLNCIVVHFMESKDTKTNKVTYPLILNFNWHNEIKNIEIKAHMKDLDMFKYLSNDFVTGFTGSGVILKPKDGGKVTYKFFVDLIDKCIDLVDEENFNHIIKRRDEEVK